MKAYVWVLAAFMLAACGQKTEEAKQPQGVTAEALKAAICPQPMGISVEKLLLNMDAGLKNNGVSSQIVDQKIQATECGYQINMVLDFGSVQVMTDEQQQVVSLGAGFDNGADVVANLKSSLAVMQVLNAPIGSGKVLETEAGKKLMEVATQVNVDAAKAGEASQDFEYGDNLYTVAKDGKTLAMVVRKKI